MKIAHLIGKPSLNGGWIKPRPRPTPKVREQLEATARSHRLIRVRLRPDLLTAAPVDEVANIIAPALKQLAAEGKVRVIINYGDPIPGSGRLGPHETADFEDGKTYEVAPTTALRLLNADPYRYLFEEVEDDADEALVVGSGDQGATIRALAEELRDARSRLAALEARPAPATTTRKRKLSDALAPDVPPEGDEENP